MLKKTAVSKLIRKRCLDTNQSIPMILTMTKIPLVILARLSEEGCCESIRIDHTTYLQRYKKQVHFPNENTVRMTCHTPKGLSVHVTLLTVLLWSI